MTSKTYDPEATCPKCGYKIVAEDYVGWVSGLPIERIRRTCGRCAFKWDELPVDHDLDAELAALEAWRDRERVPLF